MLGRRKDSRTLLDLAEYSLAYNGLGVAQMSSGDTWGLAYPSKRRSRSTTILPRPLGILRDFPRGSRLLRNWDDLLPGRCRTEPLNPGAPRHTRNCRYRNSTTIRHARGGTMHTGLARSHRHHARQHSTRSVERVQTLYGGRSQRPRRRAGQQAIVSLSTTK